eukprot:GDKJ01028959.1.p1 GENE.GDKJ01028959.1~~GDKJ01028959.1.p1  ORF type:complete len:1316 (-),score=272.86 GDKJ01028959.1:62-3553(-)
MKNGIFWPMTFLFYPDLDFRSELLRSFKESLDVMNIASTLATLVNGVNVEGMIEYTKREHINFIDGSMEWLIALLASHIPSATSRGYTGYYPPRYITSKIGHSHTAHKNNRVVDLIFPGKASSLSARDHTGLMEGLSELKTRIGFPLNLNVFHQRLGRTHSLREFLKRMVDLKFKKPGSSSEGESISLSKALQCTLDQLGSENGCELNSKSTHESFDEDLLFGVKKSHPDTRYPFRDIWRSSSLSERAKRAYHNLKFAIAGLKGLKSSKSSQNLSSLLKNIFKDWNARTDVNFTANGFKAYVDIPKVVEFCDSLAYLHNLSTLEFASQHLHCPVQLPGKQFWSKELDFQFPILLITKREDSSKIQDLSFFVDFVDHSSPKNRLHDLIRFPLQDSEISWQKDKKLDVCHIPNTSTPDAFCVRLIGKDDPSICAEILNDAIECPAHQMYMGILPSFIFNKRTDREFPIMYSGKNGQFRTPTHPLNTLRIKIYNLVKTALMRSGLQDEMWKDLKKEEGQMMEQKIDETLKVSVCDEADVLASTLLFYNWDVELRKTKKKSKENPEKDEEADDNDDASEEKEEKEECLDKSKISGGLGISCKPKMDGNSLNYLFRQPKSIVSMSKTSEAILPEENDSSAFAKPESQNAVEVDRGLSSKWFSPVLTLLLGAQEKSLFLDRIRDISLKNQKIFDSFRKFKGDSLSDIDDPLAFTRAMKSTLYEDKSFKERFIWALAVIHSSEGLGGSKRKLAERLEEDPHFRPKISIIPVSESFMQEKFYTTLIRRTAAAVALLTPDEVHALLRLKGFDDEKPDSVTCMGLLQRSRSKIVFDLEKGTVGTQGPITIAQVDGILVSLKKQMEAILENEVDLVELKGTKQRLNMNMRTILSALLQKVNESKEIDSLGGFLDECMDNDWGETEMNKKNNNNADLILHHVDDDTKKMIYSQEKKATSSNKNSATLNYYLATSNNQKTYKIIRSLHEANIDTYDGQKSFSKTVFADNVSARSTIDDYIKLIKLHGFDGNALFGDPIIFQESCQLTKTREVSNLKQVLCNNISGQGYRPINSHLESFSGDSETMGMISLCFAEEDRRSALFGWGRDSELEQNAAIAESCPLWRASQVLSSMPLIRHSSPDASTSDFGGVRHEVSPHDFCSCFLKGGVHGDKMDCI